MRKKETALIITFSTTAEAMKMERFCLKNGLPGRLIPIPTGISAECGLAWKARPEEESTLLEEIVKAAIDYHGRYVLDI